MKKFVDFGLLVLMAACFVAVQIVGSSCGKVPPEFEVEDKEDVAEETECHVALIRCELDLEASISEVDTYKELAENCVDNKIKGKRKK